MKFRLLRQLGCAKILPLKLRSKLIRKFAGTNEQCKNVAFEVGLTDGKRFTGQTSSHIDWHVYFFGEYDPLGTGLLKLIAKNSSSITALDIGANVGTHTIAMAGEAQAVHSFEPFPTVLVRLKDHVRINRLENVCVHEFGLSNQDLIAKYYENSSDNLGAGSFQPDHVGVNDDATMELPLRAGDAAIAEIGIENIGLIKIDVEGHEPFVLEGIAETLRIHRPFVFFEFGPTTLKQVPTKDDLAALFPEQYSIYRLSHQSRWSRDKPSLVKHEFPLKSNLLAVANEKHEVISKLIR